MAVRDDERRAAVEKVALLGLQQQWNVETGCLKPRERDEMTMPVFCLRDFSRTWGRWDRETRQIAIRRDLVHDYPWSCVRDVLRHEMAHQYVDEVLGGEQTPHGPLFRQACRVLRADAKATCEYAPLHARGSVRGLTEEDRLLARVKKLLALGESPNQHEAQAALAKAHQLMGRFNLTHCDSEQDRRCLSLCVGIPALRRPAWNHSLAGLLSEHYSVFCVWTPMFVAARGRMGNVLEISGLEETVQVAAYVHDFVANFVERQWDAYRQANRASQHRRNDYAIGIIEGFAQKLRGNPEAAKGGNGPGHDLIARQDALVQSHLAWMYPRLVKTRLGDRFVDPSVRRDGERVGRRLVIAQGVEAGGRAEGRFLKERP